MSIPVLSAIYALTKWFSTQGRNACLSPWDIWKLGFFFLIEVEDNVTKIDSDA